MRVKGLRVKGLGLRISRPGNRGFGVQGLKRRVCKGTSLMRNGKETTFLCRKVFLKNYSPIFGKFFHVFKNTDPIAESRFLVSEAN